MGKGKHREQQSHSSLLVEGATSSLTCSPSFLALGLTMPCKHKEDNAPTPKNQHTVKWSWLPASKEAQDSHLCRDGGSQRSVLCRTRPAPLQGSKMVRFGPSCSHLLQLLRPVSTLSPALGEKDVQLWELESPLWPAWCRWEAGVGGRVWQTTHNDLASCESTVTSAGNCNTPFQWKDICHEHLAEPWVSVLLH